MTELFAYDEPHPSGGNVQTTMTREQAIAEMRQTYPGSYGNDDECAFQDWLALNFAYHVPPATTHISPATIAAVLADALAAIEAIEQNPLATNEAQRIRFTKQDAADIVRAAMEKLGIGEAK